MKKYGVTTSGFYQLDPDGPFDGSEMPINAYCDFAKGRRRSIFFLRHILLICAKLCLFI